MPWLRTLPRQPSRFRRGRCTAACPVLPGSWSTSTSRTRPALAAGTWLVDANFTATPDENTTGGVFPQLFVCDGAANARFTNDLFNVGAGALENPTSTIVSDGDTINGGRSPWNQASPGWDRYRRISRRRCSQSPTLCLQSARVCAN
jgi:hypothetical protein